MSNHKGFTLQQLKRMGAGTTKEFEMKLTGTKLEEFGACSNQVDLFNKTFPKGTAVSEASLEKAVRVGLYIEWLACRMHWWNKYKEDTRAEYFAFSKACDVLNSEACQLSTAAYQRKRMALCRNFWRACIPAFLKYAKETK